MLSSFKASWYNWCVAVNVDCDWASGEGTEGNDAATLKVNRKSRDFVENMWQDASRTTAGKLSIDLPFYCHHFSKVVICGSKVTKVLYKRWFTVNQLNLRSIYRPVTPASSIYAASTVLVQFTDIMQEWWKILIGNLRVGNPWWFRLFGCAIMEIQSSTLVHHDVSS